MIVRKIVCGDNIEYVAKFNNNDCKEIISNIESGLSFKESFDNVIVNKRHNPYVITSLSIKDIKYAWLLKAYQMDMQSIH